MPLTVEQILRGTRTAGRQSVGNMEVIPLNSNLSDDDTFAPPDFHASTRSYGAVHLRNSSDRPSIVPPGAGWVVDQSAQDHAVCSGAFIKPQSERSLDRACCIQETQGGLIRENQGSMLILPASLRTQALSMRKDTEYSRLWGVIREFKRSVGLTGSGNLVDFLKAFAKQLDEFVAEFELVPQQVGAIVLINGQVVGVERAPSSQFWQKLWVPLIRVCYGSLAVQVARGKPLPPATRSALKVKEKSLEGLQEALRESIEEDDTTTSRIVSETHSLQLEEGKSAEEKINWKSGTYKILTVANRLLSGQIVSDGSAVTYASLCLSGGV